ncbi:hypothetical protein [Pedobacter jejuensis]|nr:hypothetical protein [Pedobacter jejuensis]
MRTLHLTISYSSLKWPILVAYIRSLLIKFSVLDKLLFFNTEKGDVIKLILFIPNNNKNFETYIVNELSEFLKKNPSKRNKSNLKPGESLWMNYPNNQVFLSDFNEERYLISNVDDRNIIFSFASLISSWLMKNPPAKKELISAFMQLIILFNRLFILEDILSKICVVIESIEEKFELRQQPEVHIEIYKHVDQDLETNVKAIKQLIFCDNLLEFYDHRFLEFDYSLRLLPFKTESFMIFYPQLINQIILHFGVDYRVQLYVLLLVKKCSMEVSVS